MLILRPNRARLWKLLSVLLAFTGVTGVAGVSQTSCAAGAVKTVVLVHGEFADGSSWSKVIPLLEAKGLKVVAVQNPLTSLADDVAATHRIIALHDGPVLLVGHSYAGAVITEAGNDPKVVGLVYVAAFSPDEGEAVGDMGKNSPAPPGSAQITADKPRGFRSFAGSGRALAENHMILNEAWCSMRPLITHGSKDHGISSENACGHPSDCGYDIGHCGGRTSPREWRACGCC